MTKYLLKALETFTNWELIFYDDKSKKIIREFIVENSEAK